MYCSSIAHDNNNRLILSVYDLNPGLLVNVMYLYLMLSVIMIVYMYLLKDVLAFVSFCDFNVPYAVEQLRIQPYFSWSPPAIFAEHRLAINTKRRHTWADIVVGMNIHYTWLGGSRWGSNHPLRV